MNIRVQGQQLLSGEIIPSGSKNSAVAIIPATILFSKPVTLENIPPTSDIKKLLKVLAGLGSKVDFNEEQKVLTIDNSQLSAEGLSEEDLGNMRGSVLLWGPLLGRFRKIKFSDLPGGCSLGMRPLDTHYLAFKDLGVRIDEGKSRIELDASRAESAEIWLHEMSPTATENALMLAVTLPGKTKIIGAASEPQVQDLCLFLRGGGAKILGIGTDVLEIDGVGALSSVRYRIFSDHNEIATFLALGAATGGEIRIKDALPNLFTPISREFSKFGVNIIYQEDTAILRAGQSIEIAKDSNEQTLSIRVRPWPGFPADILPLLVPLALAAPKGTVLFHNWMYESGLFWTEELRKLGANLTVADPHRVIIVAGNKLHGATLEAPYIIRAVVAMVMTAMIAEGETTILNADALYRGHPNLAENLSKLGAKIEEVEA